MKSSKITPKTLKAFRLEVAALALAPTDIVVVTIPVCPRATVLKLHQEVRKLLPRGQRSLIKFAGTSVDKLADIITPEELHQLNLRMERRLLAADGPGLPLQQAGT